MHFTDIFIKRPVLATVVSLAILLLGLRAGLDLKVREYPELQTAQVTVTVIYPGADAALMEGFITTPLEREIATADGIDYLGSSTGLSTSVINASLAVTSMVKPLGGTTRPSRRDGGVSISILAGRRAGSSVSVSSSSSFRFS